MLECSDKSYYIGVTNNLETRFLQHMEGINRNCYTYIRRPLKIVYYEIFNDPNSAIFFEKKIKGWNRKKKQALITGQFHLLPELSKSQSCPRSSTSSD
jgi:putative endonuclease